MSHRSEGNVLDFTKALRRGEEPSLDFAKRAVPGLLDVVKGLKPLYPVTVYTVSGDDTSGIAGMLMPDGTFIPTPAPAKRTVFWDEDFYRNEADVVWNGSVAGSINPHGEDGEHEGPINKREWDGTLHTGEWFTTGELWRAMARGTGMQRGRVEGRIHNYGGSEDDGWMRRAA